MCLCSACLRQDGVEPELLLCDSVQWCFLSHVVNAVRNGGIATNEEFPCLYDDPALCPNPLDSEARLPLA